MNKCILLCIIVLTMFCSPLPGQELFTQKVVLYYFNDESKNEDYRYYSYIIPDSIAIELKKHENFKVQTLPVTMEYVENANTPELVSDDISLLTQRGKKLNADYIVIGSYVVENFEISIRSQVFNVNTGNIVDVRSTKEKLGALLFVIIDNISNEINTKLQEQYTEEKSKIAVSPFIGTYEAMRGIEFGISYGKAYPMGVWKDTYNETEIVDVFAGYNFSNSGKYTSFVKDLACYLHFEFLSFDNEYMDDTIRSNMNVYIPSLSVGYVYDLSDRFSMIGEFSGGAAISQIRIPVGSDDGPLSPTYRENSLDPYASFSLRGAIEFNPLTFTGGIAFKRIQYKDEALNMATLLFGIIYSI